MSFGLFKKINPTKFDTDGSGTVDKNDFVSDENKQILLDSLTNIHSDTFDFEAAKEVAASWYNDSYLKSKYNDGKGSIKNNPNNKSGNYIIGKQSVPKASIDPTVALLNSNKDYPTDTSWNGVVHKRENGKYFVYDDAAGDFVEVNKDTVANSIGIMSKRYGYNSAEAEPKSENSLNLG